MRLSSRPSIRRLAPLAAAGLALALALPALLPATPRAVAAACPPGYERVGDLPPEVAVDRSEVGLVADLDPAIPDDACIAIDRPESSAERYAVAVEAAQAHTAPYAAVAPGAAEAAFAQKAELAAAAAEEPIAGTAGSWEPYGRGPLHVNEEGYQVSGLGLDEVAGRITDFDYVETTDVLYASVATGGVWRSDDQGSTWRSVGETLPTQVIGSVQHTTAGGPAGTLVAISGDGSYGAASYLGIGAFWSDDEGATWNRAGGVPANAFGFKVAVDPVRPEVVYAATGTGLFRSTDAGRNYSNAALPVGACAGKLNSEAPCLLANMVTDVVVQTPGGTGTADVDGGTVIAAVGWRGGNRANPDGTIQSAGNGLYMSATGEPGSFERSAELGFTEQDRIGRIELGAATGPAQDHDYLYAMVQDAVLFNGGLPGVDTTDPSPAGALSATAFDGLYVSADFGRTWLLMISGQELGNPASGSQLSVVGPALAGFGPGLQAWYNEWVLPDPTRQTPNGIPTRLTFGLEEIWENEVPAPMNAKTQFKVVGRYFAGGTCLLLTVPACPTDREDAAAQGFDDLTTHPDQHAAVWIPSEDGSVRLVVGNDGGVYQQTLAPGAELDRTTWGSGENDGFNTLLPYGATMARDGVVYMGLQDNGSARIDPALDQRQIGINGGDGFYASVDPDNSDVAYVESQGGNMVSTTNGGRTTTAMTPPATQKRFANVFVLDPLDPEHLITGGREIVETISGPGTGTTGWVEVFDLGTQQKPGDTMAAATAMDPFNQQTALDLVGSAAYVGYCGTCDVLNDPAPFRSGIATNVGGAAAPEPASPDGWHIAAAAGLPERFVTGIVVDPDDPRTVTVTLGGYSRRWTPPGVLDDDAMPGTGHVFRSTDAGETFADISGDLPDAPMTWIDARGDQLVVASDVGVFISSDATGTRWAPLGAQGSGAADALPNVPISTVEVAPGNPDLLTVATMGRGVYLYRFVDPQTVRRVAGPSRFSTATSISGQVFDAADAVVLARADDYADALAGAPFAFSVDAPTLLTGRGSLDGDARAEIDRLGATTAYLLGGPAALAPQVEADLRAAGVTDVVRIGGSNRFDTARLIAEQVGGAEVYVVEGANADPRRGWPDALSVAPLAAEQGRPILLATSGALPEETARALADRRATTVTVVGGVASVSQQAEDALTTAGYPVERVAGATRYETSALVAARAVADGRDASMLWVASGLNWPDALASGSAVAATDGILLLVDPTDLNASAPTRDVLAAAAATPGVLVRILGGEAAISPAVEDAIRALVGAS